MDLIDVEYLQKLAYDRSKKWSSFFEAYETIDPLVELENVIDLNQIEKVFSSAADDNFSDELSSMENDNYDDNVKSEFLKNASSASQLSLFIGNTAMDVAAVTNNEEKRQYAAVINKTLPILHEHERQLQEFGFDKVLISFKKDEIEDKFGSWLNRHNSLFGGDNTLIYNGKTKSIETGKDEPTYSKPTNIKCGLTENKEMDDSDASLQSGETARYIRSSRARAIKNSTSTIIKTHRMVSSTRESLREKYACETGNSDYYRTPCGKSHKNERAVFTARMQRRKVLRKRKNSHCCNLNYSSSDSDCSENYQRTHRRNLKFSCNKCHHHAVNIYDTPRNKRRKILKTHSEMKFSSAHRNRLYYFLRSMTSASSSSTSFNSTIEKPRDLKRHSKLRDDERPYKRESECCCFNDKALCKQYKHVADTSTEECYVDNGRSPKRQLRTPMTQIEKSQQPKSCQSEKLPVSTEKNMNIFKIKGNLKENKNEQEGFLSESSNPNNAINQEPVPKKDKKIKSAKPKRKLSKIDENVAERTPTKNKILSQKTDNVAIKLNAKELNEETFFAPTQNQAICNSTALSSEGHAYKRQLADKQGAGVYKIVDSSAKSEDDKTVINDRSDCAYVTSATTIEIPISKETKKAPEQNRKLDHNEKLTGNCVLIYDPENRDMIPANSFTADGYFTVTREHLSTLIGKTAAHKFLRYYIGRKVFKPDAMVYYRPPTDSFLFKNLSSSSESTDDFEFLYQCGDLFAITK